MLYLSPRLALVTFAVMPLMVIAIWIFTEQAKVAYRRTRVTVGAVAAGFQENVDGVRVVQAFAREAASQDAFDRLNEDNRLANINANTLSSGLMPVVELRNALATVAVIWYGGCLVLPGRDVTLGVLVAFLAYVTRFFQPLRTLTQFYNQLQAATAGAEKVFELLDEPVTIDERPDPSTLDHGARRRRVPRRRLRLRLASRCLKDVSFHVPAGQDDRAGRAHRRRQDDHRQPAGALLRSGRGRDPARRPRPARPVVRDAALRASAVVLQDNFLFSGTIADNIRYGRPDATDEEVHRRRRSWPTRTSFISACRTATTRQVMERAANLSLGQRQLIAIARAVLADPRVLILDEATSNVDPHTELLVQQALHTLLAGRTSLVIAHRLSTIRAADEVLVLDGGEIVERGRHEELLRTARRLLPLYQQQFASPEENAAADTRHLIHHLNR